MKNLLAALLILTCTTTSHADQCKNALGLMQTGVAQIDTAFKLCQYPNQASTARSHLAEGYRNVVDGSYWCEQYCGSSYNCAGYRQQIEGLYQRVINSCR